MPPKLRTDPTIRRLAADLKLRVSADPDAAVLRMCRKRIQAFLAELPCSTLGALLELACARLNTIFIELHSDADLHAVERRYVERREPAFADLAGQLGPDVYAITFFLSNPEPLGRPFVSLIDCRGQKAPRAYFSKWHELAHLLTLTPQMRLRFCRTHAEPSLKDPEEALMDVIAGDLGFFAPLVTPRAEGRISFAKIELLREELCPEASGLAATIGFVRSWPQPAILIQARLAARREHQHAGFDFHKAGSTALRAVKVTANERAQDRGVLIPQNMRVPERSVIGRVFRGEDAPVSAEDLSWWESRGRALRALAIRVEARRRHDHVEAIITLQ